MQLKIPVKDDTPEWEPFEVPPDLTAFGYHIGTSGYHFDDWIGTFNPPRTSRGDLSENEKEDQDRLLFYQKYFTFLEINNTFYREPSISYFTNLEKRSKDRISYAVKVFREISHSKSRDPDTGKELMRRHVNTVAPLKYSNRFFTFLIQLEDRHKMTQRNLDYLLQVSSVSVQSGFDVHIEFRHRSWHDVGVLQSLKDSGIGICNTEIPAISHAFPLKAYATSSKGYIRYSGRNLENWYPEGKQVTSKEKLQARNARYDYSYSAREVAERVQGQIALRQKTTGVAIAYNNHYNAQAVLNGIQNLKLLNQKLFGEASSQATPANAGVQTHSHEG